MSTERDAPARRDRLLADSDCRALTRIGAGLIVLGVLVGRVASAETVIIDSALTDAYHFVDTYEILIDATPGQVWPHLVDFGSWMDEFSMIHESGPRRAEGEVIRLYEGQDYFMELAKLVPGKLVVAVNLPSEIGGEQLTGVGVFTLTAIGGKTLVSNFMSRHFVWLADMPDALRERRASAEFQQSTHDRWKRILERLRERVESDE